MPTTVSIGVCAHNEVRRIVSLLESVSIQTLPRDFELVEIIVVASGCTDGTVDVVQEWAKVHPELKLIHELERRGKASAIDRILHEYRSEILILVNADARLAPGSLGALLTMFRRDGAVQLGCGCPIPESSRSPTVSRLEDAWWRLHNRTLDALALKGQGNHCCDELMAMKRGFTDSIPKDITCDGSYFGMLAATRGITVQFCSEAIVFVETPSTLRGLLTQRRRNLRGHWQVSRLFGRNPYTLEALARIDPALAARILMAEFFQRPIRMIAFLAVAIPFEIIAHSLARLDGAVGRGFQPVWPMVD